MKFAEILELTREMPCFDISLLTQAYDTPRANIRVQLARWVAQGKLIPLRRSWYAIAAPYRAQLANPATLAHRLVRPSYLSGLWALSYYDLIPERVVWFTSVTTRSPKNFHNQFGVFDYRHIKQEAFWGYVMAEVGGGQFYVAEAEKALLDHWHLTKGKWSEERLTEMRYQHTPIIDQDKLQVYSKRYNSPRLEHVVKNWRRLMTEMECPQELL